MTIEAPPLWLQGGTYPARLDRFSLDVMYEEGVLNPIDCKVTQRAAGANFSVDVAVGSFIVQGDDQALQGKYLGRITAAENAVIGAAPGSNSRYDLVTLRINDPNAGGNAGNTASVVVVAGTVAASPVVPALPLSSIPLAVIGPISSSTASITNSIIGDTYNAIGPAYARTCRMIAGQRSEVATLKLRASNASSVNGWLLCDGSQVSRTTFAALFAEIGTSYGVGDNSTTFNLPNFQDRVPVARGTSFPTVGASGGEVNHTLTVAELATHAHFGSTGNADLTHIHGISFNTDSTGAHTHVVSDSANFQASGWAGKLIGDAASGSNFATPWVVGAGDPLVAKSAGAHTHAVNGVTQNPATSLVHSHTIPADGSSTPHNNMQPYQVVAGWMIKY